MAAGIANAGVITSGVQSFGSQVYGGTPKPPQVLAALILFSLMGLLGIIAVALIVYAGFLWMTSQGKEDVIKKAKNILISAVIGLLIIFSAYAIASFVVEQILNAAGPGASGGGGGVGAINTTT